MEALKHLVSGILLLGLLVAETFPVDAAPASAGEIVNLSNEFVQVLVNEQGQFTIGSVGGDPLIAGDDNKVLVYGYDRNGLDLLYVRPCVQRRRRDGLQLD